MRKLLLSGTTGLVFVLGVVKADAIPVLNKDASPYAILNPQAQPPNAIVSVIEGRSAFTGQAVNGALAATPETPRRTHR